MIKSKDDGITLITVIIAVVLMLVLISVGTKTGIDMYREAKVKKFVSQMQLIQAKVDEVVSGNETTGLGAQVTNENKEVLLAAYNNEEISNNTEAYFNSFKLFSLESLKNNLDLENIDAPVLINFTTREVVSTKGVEYGGKTYYTQYLLEGGQRLVDYQPAQRTLHWTISKEINGLNCLVKITNVYPNATLTYGEEVNEQVENWNTISNYTQKGEEYSVNITKTGKYIFKATNNETNASEQQTVNIVVTNKPNTEMVVNSYDYSSGIENWGHTGGYIWIPRFAYNNSDNSNIKFIKGNSNISTDNTYIDLDSWTVPSIFTKDNKELTGIWVLQSTIENYLEEENENIEEMEFDIQKIQYIILNNTITGEEIIEPVATG